MRSLWPETITIRINKIIIPTTSVLFSMTLQLTDSRVPDVMDKFNPRVTGRLLSMDDLSLGTAKSTRETDVLLLPSPMTLPKTKTSKRPPTSTWTSPYQRTLTPSLLFCSMPSTRSIASCNSKVKGSTNWKRGSDHDLPYGGVIDHALCPFPDPLQGDITVADPTLPPLKKRHPVPK